MTTTKVYILDRTEASGRGTNTPARFFNPTHTLDSFRRDARRDGERGETIGHGQQVSKSLSQYVENARGAREGNADVPA